MPRYHFHLQDGSFIADEEGSEHADLDAARVYAVRAARELMANQLRGDDGLTIDDVILITNREGRNLCAISFRMAAGPQPS